MKFLEGHDDSEKFFSGDTIRPLCLCECFAEVRNDPFLSFLHLKQNCPNITMGDRLGTPGAAGNLQTCPDITVKVGWA